MLYDPKWEIQTKADPLSLESLIAWLETMPPNEEYDFDNWGGGCLVGLYMASRGLPWKEGGNRRYTEFSKAFRTKNGLSIAALRPRTFGGALDRAREAASKH